jgi:hypothetical protein
MSDSEEGGSPAAEERKRESKLLARTRKAGKQAVVFDEDEDEGGGHVTTSIQASASLAKTWSPGSGAGPSLRNYAGVLDDAPASSGHLLQSLSRGGASDALRDSQEEKFAAKLRAERIAKRAAKLREIEERDGAPAQKGGFGGTFGGDHHDAPGDSENVTAPGAEPKNAGKTTLSKLDHRAVFGNRRSAVDGLLDLGVGAQRKKAAGAQDGLDLDVGSLKRGGLVHSPRAHKGNRASKRAVEERRKEAYFAERDASSQSHRPAEVDDDELAHPQARQRVQDAKQEDAASNTPADGNDEDEMGEDEMGEMEDEDDGPLGAMLKEMASKLGNYSNTRELARELKVLKAALAGEEEEDGSGGGDAPSRASHGLGAKEGPHRTSVGKAPAAEFAGGMGKGRARAILPAGARAPQAIVRDDISSSDDSSDERPRDPRGKAGRQPHIYLAQGLREAAGVGGGRATLPRDNQEKRERRCGSDEEQDMRPVTPPSGSEPSDGTIDHERAPKFAGSKKWSPQRGAGELQSKAASVADDDADNGGGLSDMMAAKRAERQQKLERLPKSNFHHRGIETFTDTAALEHRERMRKLEQEEAIRERGVADMQSETTSVVGEEDSPPSSRPSTSDGRFLGHRGKSGGGRGGRFTQTYSLKHPFPGANGGEDDDFRRKTPHVMGGVVFCGECGEPNKSGALYCSCGEPLAGDDDYSSPSKPREPTSDNEGTTMAVTGGGIRGGESPLQQGSQRVSVGAVPDSHQRDGSQDAGGGGGKPSIQRHRGAPKVPMDGGTRGLRDRQRPLADEANAREEGLSGEGEPRGVSLKCCARLLSSIENVSFCSRDLFSWRDLT